jgi:hypothetical protein
MAGQLTKDLIDPTRPRQVTTAMLPLRIKKFGPFVSTRIGRFHPALHRARLALICKDLALI